MVWADFFGLFKGQWSMRPFLLRYGAHCCAEQVDITEGCPKIDLFAFKGHDRVLHIGWSYGVGPKVEMRLF